MQAMAMRITTVVTPLIAQPIGITHGDNGLVADRGSNYLDIILKYISREKDLIKIGNSARNHVKTNFSWSAIAEKYRTVD